jgi:hypothetical protein
MTGVFPHNFGCPAVNRIYEESSPRQNPIVMNCNREGPERAR